MSNPPNKTRTQPGLGEGGADAVPRMDSAELKRVRQSRPDADETDAPPHSVARSPIPASVSPRPRLRDSVRREDPDDPPAAERPVEILGPRTPVGQRLRDSVRREDPDDPPPVSVRPRLRDSVRREDPEDSTTSSPREEQVSLRSSGGGARRGSALWQPEKETGLRAKAQPSSSSSSPGRSRPPVTVDEVGATALKIARTTQREGAPKLLASRAIVSKAPIDTRSAFVLSLVDGRNTVGAIVDMSGMPEDEVKSILERLARLGLIQLP